MALRLNSLKTRTAVALSSVIVAVLTINAVYLILTKRGELRRDIENRAELFASLTAKPICVGYETYYASGFYKFQELIGYYLALEPDLERVRIINVNGKILFDSAELQEGAGQREGRDPERWIEGAERLEAIKRLELTPLPARDAAGNEVLEVIAPYIEDWGRHRLSVSYTVHYRNLRPNISRLIGTTVGLTVASMLVSVLIAVALSTRITRPLEELTAGAKGLAEGHFDRRLAIRSGGDELTLLAETFNHMTERLKHNVEQLEESNKKLAAVNEELKELDRMKSDLLANVSHELRTPLTAIKGYTDYILDGKLGAVTEKQERGLVVVQRNLERLSKSINALLDFSRMDAGRIALSIQPFSLLQLVEQIHGTLRSELEKKRVSFQLDVPAELPPVIGDRDKLSQVIENLVINAIKFTPEGGRIGVGAVRTEGKGRAAAEVSVTDTGIGIPEAQLGKIFSRFHQVDGTTTRRFGGVGLGLAIVKSILDAHGAAIRVESEVGRGTSFRFVLPVLERGAEAAEARPEAVRASPRSSEALVLVVDDDPEMQRATRESLEREGFAVVTASTAQEGASLAARRRPDVILLDLLLPDRNGLELLQSLKTDPATQEIPVLVVSITKDSVKALSLGAAECLVKPVDGAAIVPMVRRLLDGSFHGATVLVVDDETDTADFIRETLKTEGLRVLVAHDGRQAIEVLERRRPDLVLLDIMMPELSGFEVLEAIASNPATAGTPVIVLTARGDEGDAKRGLALGARRYMSKPFDVRDLIAEVLRQVGSRTGEGRSGGAAL
ncbi:MAG TPA: response regulator [Vicinamibacteria bacterium]|nr:response regulator [Vicinamibacteria bacterium]